MKSFWISLTLAIFTIFSCVGGAFAVIKSTAAVNATRIEIIEREVHERYTIMNDVYVKLSDMCVTLGRVDERLKNIEKD